MADDLAPGLFNLIGSLALLWTGVTLIRISKRFAAIDVPPPFNTERGLYKVWRTKRDLCALAGAGVGLALILAGAGKIIL